MSLAYSDPELIAALKMLGLVVTPTTAEDAIRDGSEWTSVPVIFERDKSSNQIEVWQAFNSSTLDVFTFSQPVSSRLPQYFQLRNQIL